ncbi:glycosyltransferase [Anaerosporobacter sp.]|uniref:glycosyltransferase n=1 Tax=Anaerosporobacter sp. TaxID=1872529 RepID=UPI00286F0401|nr:glycosyltransferase [Anaerosporobacter sp.]
MKESKNVLHICASLNGGGVERMLQNYVCAIKDETIQFHIIKHQQAEGMLEKALQECGCKITYIIPKSKNVFQYTKELITYMKQNQIDVVHCHQGYVSFFPLGVAKLCGVKKRIAHGHTAFEKESRIRKWYRALTTCFTKMVATDLLACGDSAGRWMWHKNYTVIPNAMQVEQFYFSETMRIQKRKELNIDNQFVIGCVSRLVPDKNHMFLLEIFREIRKKEPNATLVLVGDGSCYDEILNDINQYNIEKNVLLLKIRNDVSSLLNAFDAFVLPTKYEGLGICFIEAQINGLPTFAPQGAVPVETKITSQLSYLPMGNPETWADSILLGKRQALSEEENQAIEQYDIAIQPQKLLNVYRGEDKRGDA